MTVIESIYNEPENWRQKEYTLQHKNGAKVWTANVPVFDTNMFPATSMSFMTKIRLYIAVRWWANNAPVSAFNRR